MPKPVALPVAFATPISAPGLKPLLTFDPASPATVQRLLLDFDALLRMEHAQWLLGLQVVQLGAAARHAVFKVNCRDKLLAVVDFRRGEAAVAPDLRPLEVQRSDWIRLPDEGTPAPSHFARSSPAQLSRTTSPWSRT
jgi:hypothetical protein